ncbi:MAG: tetratricopeptide repeat protein [Planctomycetes bacterium]|nr:tetratricopeptide repeat protein [Planctomycetota bacterium]
MKRVAFLLLAAFVVLAVWWGRRAYERRGASDGAAPAASVETVLARERAAAKFETGDLAGARKELAPLVAAEKPELEDLVRAAIVDYVDRPSSDPEPFFARIRAAQPENPSLHFMQARMALERGDFEGALAHFERVRRGRPDDLPTRVALAATLTDLGRPDEARPLLDDVLALGVERAGIWYVQAVYRLWQLELRSGPGAEAQRLKQLYEQLARLGYGSADARLLDQGELARLRAPRPKGIAEAAPPRAPNFTAEPPVAREFAGARKLFAHDLDGDGDIDFLAAGPRGLFAAFASPDGFHVETIVDGAVEHVRAVDLGNHDSLDLVVCRGARVSLLEHRTGAELLFGDPSAQRWTESPVELPSLPSPPADLVAVDFDHDGDLDLLLVGAFGARLFRDDGAAPRVDAQGTVRSSTCRRTRRCRTSANSRGATPRTSTAIPTSICCSAARMRSC